MQFAILASMLIVALILSLSFDVDLEAESIYKVRLWLPREWLISDWPSHRALYSSARTSSSSPLSSMHITMIIAGRRRRPLANIRRQRNAASSPVWLLLQPTHCRHHHSQNQQIPMETTKKKTFILTNTAPVHCRHVHLHHNQQHLTLSQQEQQHHHHEIGPVQKIWMWNSSSWGPVRVPASAMQCSAEETS